MFGRYTYVGNETVNGVDPSGMLIEEIKQFVNDVINGNIGSTSVSDAATRNYNSTISNDNSGKQTFAQGMNINMDVDSGVSQGMARMGAAIAFDMKEEMAITGAAVVTGVALTGVALEGSRHWGCAALAEDGTAVYGAAYVYGEATIGPIQIGSRVIIANTLQILGQTGTLTRVAGKFGIEEAIAAQATRKTLVEHIVDAIRFSGSQVDKL